MFPFEFDKALEVAAHFLRRQDVQVMETKRLLKLIYFANRRFLSKACRPIIGGETIATDRGPVPLEIQNLLSGEDPNAKKWSDFIVCSNYQTRLVKDPGNDSLSQFEIEIMDEVSDEFKNSDEFELIPIACGFREWKRCRPKGNRSKKIPFEYIVSAVRKHRLLSWIRSDAEAQLAIHFLQTNDNA